MKISEEQFIKLGKLKEKADKLQKELEEICTEAEFITKEFDGFTFDFIYNDFLDSEKLLERLEITVVDKVG